MRPMLYGVLLLVLVAAPVGPAAAGCLDCSPAADNAATAIAVLEVAAATGSYCEYPWGGVPNGPRTFFQNALAHAVAANNYLNQALQTCSCATVQSAVDQLEDALVDVDFAADLCNSEFCTGDALAPCGYTSFASMYLQMALAEARTCESGACVVRPPIIRPPIRPLHH